MSPEVTQEKRTVMYSVETDGKGVRRVARHVFPFNAEDPMGMAKLMKFVRRGFTFDDPRVASKTGIPQVIVTRQVELARAGDRTAVTDEAMVATVVEPMPTVSEAVIVEEASTQAIEALSDLITQAIRCPECGKGPFVSFLGLQLHRNRYCGQPKEKHHSQG